MKEAQPLQNVERRGAGPSSEAIRPPKTSSRSNARPNAVLLEVRKIEFMRTTALCISLALLLLAQGSACDVLCQDGDSGLTAALAEAPCHEERSSDPQPVHDCPACGSLTLATASALARASGLEAAGALDLPTATIAASFAVATRHSSTRTRITPPGSQPPPLGNLLLRKSSFLL